MQDSRIQTVLLRLLALGIWGDKSDDKIAITLTESEWAQLYLQVKLHTVEAIVFDSLNYLPSGSFPPHQLLLNWAARVDAIERANERMDRVIAQQWIWFIEQGLRPIMLKGQGIAINYPNPKHRMCGDIDWVFSNKMEYQRAKKALRRIGVVPKDTAGYSCSFLWNGIETELHQKIFDIHNPFIKRSVSKWESEVFANPSYLQVEGVKVAIPAPDWMVLQVNLHILKHLFSFGIGLRQFCDLAILYKTQHSKLDEQLLTGICRKIGVTRWNRLLNELLVQRIGLSRYDLPICTDKQIDTDWLLDEVWKAGNFGFANESTDRLRPFAHIFSNIKRYFAFAPMEAISFPIVHWYSKIGI